MIQYVTNIIIHGLRIHNCKRTGNAMVRSSPLHFGWRTMADGDGISIFIAITISNNLFTHHNEVMQVTVAYNHFGEGLVQRMPRHGYFHVVNNNYTHWELYAIGGSANPTINSEGNGYVAPSNLNAIEGG
ncbi:putative pectate lyase [Helianthus debilis subsp. tardiflorus]